MDKILKNNTASIVDVTDVGIEVPASGTFTIEPTDYWILAASDDTSSLLTAGTLTMNDGTSDLSTSDGINFLKFGEDYATWNADRIQGITVDDTDIANGKILKYNSTSGNLEYEDDETSASVFGTHYNYLDSDGESTTTSNGWVDKVNLTTTSLDAGDYLVQWSAEISCPKEDMVEARMMIGGSGEGEVTMHHKGEDATVWSMFSGMKEVTLTAGAVNLKIQYGQTDLGGTGRIRNARISIWRVA